MVFEYSSNKKKDKPLSRNILFIYTAFIIRTSSLHVQRTTINIPIYKAF